MSQITKFFKKLSISKLSKSTNSTHRMSLHRLVQARLFK